MLDHVVTCKQDLYKDYRQEDEGISERIQVDPRHFTHYTQIPHRPVVKMNDQSSTKIRLVFNCAQVPR